MSTWHQITVDGSIDTLRGFVTAFEALRGPGVLLAADLNLEGHGLPVRILDLLAAGTYHRVLAPAPQAQELVQALAEHGGRASLELVALHVVRSATLPVRAKAYTPEAARKLRCDFVLSLPEGVTMTDLHEAEEDLPGDGVPGVYDPSHRFEAELSGCLVGPLPGVLEMARRAQDNELVTPGEVRLHLEELPLP